jgi:enolase-phosphatase E1
MIRAIVTDIEGTTSSLSFVKNTLFPYARERMRIFVSEHSNTPAVKEQLDVVRELVKKPSATPDQIADQLIEWIDQDKKITPLKTLQGLIWEAGYHKRDYTGHVYEDAVVMLKEWHDLGLVLSIYSSGSVYAQKLLFAHTDYGDLTPLFSFYFDTQIGGKREIVSYERIAMQLELPAENILFLSDIVEELDAAALAGLKTVQLVRPGEASVIGVHPVASSFTQIDPAAFQNVS